MFNHYLANKYCDSETKRHSRFLIYKKIMAFGFFEGTRILQCIQTAFSLFFLWLKFITNGNMIRKLICDAILENSVRMQLFARAFFGHELNINQIIFKCFLFQYYCDPFVHIVTILQKLFVSISIIIRWITLPIQLSIAKYFTANFSSYLLISFYKTVF